MNKGQKGLMPKRIAGHTVTIGGFNGARGSMKIAPMSIDPAPAGGADIAGVVKRTNGDLCVVVQNSKPSAMVAAVDCVSLKQARFICWKYAEALCHELRKGYEDTLQFRLTVMSKLLAELNKRQHSGLTEALTHESGITASGASATKPSAVSSAESSLMESPTLEQDQASHDDAVTSVLMQQTVSLSKFIQPAINADSRAAECDGFPQHSAFAALKERVALGGIRNYLLVGPAGSGKTTLAKNLAEDLGLPFGIMSITAGVTESHLLGRILPPTYELVPSPFVRIYNEGGVFLLDEVDAADPNVLLTVNSALANGVLVTPDGRTWDRHPDTYILAAANTWGKGAERGYSGRNQLDRSTRDRFTLKSFEMDYCNTMEAGIARKNLAGRLADRLSILAATMAIRHAADEKRIEETVSARFVEEASTFIANGATLQFCVAELLTTWSPTDREKVSEITKEIKPFVKLCERVASKMEAR